jgi:hypothetical protein
MPTLFERRHQADMVMTHKILHEKGGLDHTTWFEKAENGPRATRNTADPYNIKVKHGRLDLRRNFFSIRVIHQRTGTGYRLIRREWTKVRTSKQPIGK